MFISKKGAKLTNEHFLGTPGIFIISKVGIGRRRLKHGIGIGRRIKRKPSISRSLDLDTSPSSSEISKVRPRYEKQLKETNLIYNFYFFLKE